MSCELVCEGLAEIQVCRLAPVGFLHDDFVKLQQSLFPYFLESERRVLCDCQSEIQVGRLAFLGLLLHDHHHLVQLLRKLLPDDRKMFLAPRPGRKIDNRCLEFF